MTALLVPVDFSDVTDRVLAVTARLAGALGGRVRLLHVAAPDLEDDFGSYESGRQLRVGAEVLVPFFQDLDGPQLEVKPTVEVGVQYSFGAFGHGH